MGFNNVAVSGGGGNTTMIILLMGCCMFCVLCLGLGIYGYSQCWFESLGIGGDTCDLSTGTSTDTGATEDGTVEEGDDGEDLGDTGGGNGGGSWNTTTKNWKSKPSNVGKPVCLYCPGTTTTKHGEPHAYLEGSNGKSYNILKMTDQGDGLYKVTTASHGGEWAGGMRFKKDGNGFRIADPDGYLTCGSRIDWGKSKDGSKAWRIYEASNSKCDKPGDSNGGGGGDDTNSDSAGDPKPIEPVSSLTKLPIVNTDYASKYPTVGCLFTKTQCTSPATTKFYLQAPSNGLRRLCNSNNMCMYWDNTKNIHGWDTLPNIQKMYSGAGNWKFKARNDSGYDMLTPDGIKRRKIWFRKIA